MKTAKYISFILIVGALLVFSGCTRTANKTGPLKPYPEITNDIEIGEQIRGEGTRAELLGFIRWGDAGRASFRAHEQEHDLGGAVVKQSMQSAVYDALEGQPDHFIVDPHFHTVEHNFLILKLPKLKLSEEKQIIKNYRQVKRFNTDQTETLLLEDSPKHILSAETVVKPRKLLLLEISPLWSQIQLEFMIHLRVFKFWT